MGLIEDLAARLDRVEAELALHRLAHDYCIGADHRDLARWQQVWTADGVWETGPDRAYRGIEQITAAVSAQWQSFPVMQHSTVNHVVEVFGETAVGRSDVVVQVQLGDGRWIVGGGTYEDEYRRESGRWRISRRRVARPFDLPILPAEFPTAATPPPTATPTTQAPTAQAPTSAASEAPAPAAPTATPVASEAPAAPVGAHQATG